MAAIVPVQWREYGVLIVRNVLERNAGPGRERE